MIQSLQINHYRNHVGTRFEFGRFTLMAGPNGVGKSNVLRCLASFGVNGQQSRIRQESDLVASEFDMVLELLAGDDPWVAATNARVPVDETVFYRRPNERPKTRRRQIRGVSLDPDQNRPTRPDFDGFFYLKPELPNLSSPHFSDSAQPALHSNGLGLASVLAYLMTSAPERFVLIQEALREIVPQVVRIRAARELVEVPELQTVTVKSREIAYSETREVPGDALLFDMRSAEGLMARDVSDGTLIVLALLTAIHQEPRPRVLLIDDIETGLHPAAQQSLMAQIRHLLEQFPELQIVATTHSPFIIDECTPEEVWLLSPDADGNCHAAQLSRHPQAEEALKILTTGEFWTAEGEEWVLSEDEAPKPASPVHAG